MNFATPSPHYLPQNSPPQTESVMVRSRLQLKNPEDAVLQEYTTKFTRIAIEGGRVLLRLRESPRIQLDIYSQTCKVSDWGITFPVAEVANLQRALARTFLSLLSKAELDSLTDEEAEQWASILRHVDYQTFSSDRSPPRYFEGVLLRRIPEIRVRWHDGEEQTIGSSAALALGVLNEGERFGAFVKRDRSRKVVSIESVDILPSSHAEFAWPEQS
jgi:hypothetical protein